MPVPEEVAAPRPHRIDAEEAVGRLEAGQPVTILDARSEQAWFDSGLRVRGDVRIGAGPFRIDPAWPRDRLTVAYCT